MLPRFGGSSLRPLPSESFVLDGTKVHAVCTGGVGGRFARTSRMYTPDFVFELDGHRAAAARDAIFVDAVRFVLAHGRTDYCVHPPGPVSVLTSQRLADLLCIVRD